MISKEKLDLAVKQIVDNCLNIKKGEKACVVTDNETKHIGLAIADRMKLTSQNVQIFIMEEFGARSDDGVDPLLFPDIIRDALLASDVSVYAAQRKKNELQSFRKPMLATINSNKRLRHAHMIGVNDKIMETGMAVDYQAVSRVTKKVAKEVTKAKKITVTTALGTNMTATFNPNWRWATLDGFSVPGHWNNLPEGEVFTCPRSVDGKVVVDGVLGDYLSGKYGIIEKNPLHLEIKGGFITSVACKNKEIENDVKEYIGSGENANRIGEFAVGTNIGLTSLIGNLLQDEKFPGVHIAVGDPYPDKIGADWKSSVHMDMVIQKVTIDVDGKIIMKDGKFLI